VQAPVTHSSPSLLALLVSAPSDIDVRRTRGTPGELAHAALSPAKPTAAQSLLPNPEPGHHMNLAWEPSGQAKGFIMNM
jgi:hypothetical protein